MATVDMKVAIHPRIDRDRDFGAGSGGKRFMQDNRLCVGLSWSPYIFTQISDLVVRCQGGRPENSELCG